VLAKMAELIEPLLAGIRPRRVLAAGHSGSVVQARTAAAQGLLNPKVQGRVPLNLSLLILTSKASSQLQPLIRTMATLAGVAQNRAPLLRQCSGWLRLAQTGPG